MMDICHLCFIHLLYVLAEAAQRGGSTRRGEVHGGRPGVTEVRAFKSALLQNAQKTLFCGEGCKRGTSYHSNKDLQEPPEGPPASETSDLCLGPALQDSYWLCWTLLGTRHSTTLPAGILWELLCLGLESFPN